MRKYLLLVAIAICATACHRSDAIYWEKCNRQTRTPHNFEISFNAEVPAPTSRATKNMRRNVLLTLMNDIDDSCKISTEDLSTYCDYFFQQYAETEVWGEASLSLLPIETNDHFVIFRTVFSDYSGATRGYWGESFHTYDRKTGNPIRSRDIWTARGKRRLARYIADRADHIFAAVISGQELKSACRRIIEENEILVTPDSLYLNRNTYNGMSFDAAFGLSRAELSPLMKSSCPIKQYWDQLPEPHD